MKAIIVVILSILYVINPIDIIPDVIPILGWLDDAGVIIGAIGALTK